jgi:hypothetical protein
MVPPRLQSARVTATDLDAASAGDLTLAEEVREAALGMAPWMTSLLMHLSFVMLALFLGCVILPDAGDKDGGVFVPTQAYSTVSDGKPLSGGGTPTEFKTASVRQIEQGSVTPGGEPTVTEAPTDKPDLVGVGSAPGVIGEPGTGNGFFGFPTGTGREPGGGLKGPGDGVHGNRAKRIAFVIDASGSLTESFDLIIRELKSSIRGLGPDQSFTVIFFQRDNAIEAPPRGLKPATDATKASVQQWVDPGDGGSVRPGGSSNPMAAIRLAMKYKPQLIFLLTDNITGSGPWELDKNQVLSEINALDSKGEVSINTIQFLRPEPLGTLKQIAKEHHGEHRMINHADLLLARPATGGL